VYISDETAVYAVDRIRAVCVLDVEVHFDRPIEDGYDRPIDTSLCYIPDYGYDRPIGTSEMLASFREALCTPELEVVWSEGPDHEGIMLMFDLLKLRTIALKEVRLSGAGPQVNMDTSDLFSVVTEALRSDCKLEKLQFTLCASKLDENWQTMMCRALETNSCLTHLFLNVGELGERGIQKGFKLSVGPWKHMLSKNRSLRVLSLHGVRNQEALEDLEQDKRVHHAVGGLGSSGELRGWCEGRYSDRPDLNGLDLLGLWRGWSRVLRALQLMARGSGAAAAEGGGDGGAEAAGGERL